MSRGKKKDSLYSKLRLFAQKHGVAGKGPLSTVLVLTRRTSQMRAPFAPEDFLTPKGGQVKGLGGSAVRPILAEHGIKRVLAEEGGRTSRGSIDLMRAYVAFLNVLHAENELDFRTIEAWWVERVREFFAGQPLRLRTDASKSLRHLVSELIEAAFKRQDDCPGTAIAGAVMQHLVGAKLSVALPNIEIRHEGFSVADAPGRRKGDFLVHDTVIYVTTAPTEALLRKCAGNLAENLRPVIITTENGAGGARALARDAELADRLDILEIEQFIATNVYEWSSFEHDKRSTSIDDLVKAYNKIIDECETDPSLKISLG